MEKNFIYEMILKMNSKLDQIDFKIERLDETILLLKQYKANSNYNDSNTLEAQEKLPKTNQHNPIVVDRLSSIEKDSCNLMLVDNRQESLSLHNIMNDLKEKINSQNGVIVFLLKGKTNKANNTLFNGIEKAYGYNNNITAIEYKIESTEEAEYVLIYTKNINSIINIALPRKYDRFESLRRYKNPDNDPKGRYIDTELDRDLKRNETLQDRSIVENSYGIQNLFTGEIVLPKCRWYFDKEEVKKCLEEHGSKYKEKIINKNNRLIEALILDGYDNSNNNLQKVTLQEAKERAEEIYKHKKPRPHIFFRSNNDKKLGYGKIAYKVYLKEQLKKSIENKNMKARRYLSNLSDSAAFNSLDNERSNEQGNGNHYTRGQYKSIPIKSSIDVSKEVIEQVMNLMTKKEGSTSICDISPKNSSISDIASSIVDKSDIDYRYQKVTI